MSGVLGSIGGILGKAAPAIAGGSGIMGLIGNIMQARTRGQETGKLQEAEKKYANLTPEQLSGLVTRAENPLSQDLLQNVGNLVQADMGQRGLSQAPGIFAGEMAQTLAPYRLQEQQKALQLIMRQLGLPIEYAEAILGSLGKSTDVSPLLAMLMKQSQGPAAAPGLTVPPTPPTTGGGTGDVYSE